ncbi:MAG: 2-oxoacid:acceptor oxidoreductase family protein [Acidobacteriota bacterium]|nr:2-oxoacid:acceptor oxidoreductase family protein [Acidobacteriota bacterium]
MRGGTAHCHVNISEEEIGSPLVSRPTVLVAMNQPSMEKFEGELEPGAVLLLNDSMVPGEPSRKDVDVVRVRATEMAEELGNARAANMVMLGAFAGYTGALNLETCLAALDTLIKRKALIDLNRKAITAGFEAGRKARS